MLHSLPLQFHFHANFAVDFQRFLLCSSLRPTFTFRDIMLLRGDTMPIMFSEILKELRKREGLTQEELAKK